MNQLNNTDGVQIQIKKKKIDVLIKWDGYEEPTWEPVEVIKKDDSITLAKYTDEKALLVK